MKQKKQNALTVLLGYAGSHRRLTFLGLGLSAVSMVCSMIPYPVSYTHLTLPTKARV